MRKDFTIRRNDGSGKTLALVFTVAALVSLLIAAGCTTSQPAPAPVTTPPTTVPTTAPPTTMMVITTPTVDPSVAADKAFAAAAEACFNATPVITNLTERMAFATCMQETSIPPGNCAQNFRYYVLKYTNEDSSTAGFARENENNRLAREAFVRGEGFDGIRQVYVPCGNDTLIKTSFYK